MMKNKKTLFLNDNEEKEVYGWIEELIKRDTGIEGYEVESGGLRLTVDEVNWEKGTLNTTLYRAIGFIEIADKRLKRP